MQLFDLHCDTLGVCLREKRHIRAQAGAVDLRRGRCFQPWIQAFAAFLPDGLSPQQAQRLCCQQLDLAHEWAAKEPDFCLWRGPADWDGDPQLGCVGLLTVENGGVLGNDTSVLDILLSKHVKVIGFTWNGDNDWASGCLGNPDRGLSCVGRSVARRLNEVGAVVDVSHLNITGFWELLDYPTLSVVATHSNAAAVFAHPRNLSDAQFAAIRERGGVVGLNLYAGHLGPGEFFSQFQRHLEHFLSLDGESCVCLGTDLDGMDIPDDWDGMCIIGRLWQYLLDKGYPQSLLQAIFYENARDFFVRALQ